MPDDPNNPTRSLYLALYVDASFAGDLQDRRSTSGYILLLAGAAIYWKSQKQTLVTLSTSESEFVALSDATCDAVWLRRAAIELGLLDATTPITTFTDSQGALGLACAVPTQRTKHVDVRAHFVHQGLANGLLSLSHVPDIANTADTLTKTLPRPRFEACRAELGVHPI